MNHDNLIMAEEDYDRLRAKREAYRSVVRKMIDESEQILLSDSITIRRNSTTQDDRCKRQNRLILILTMLKEKMELLVDLHGKLLDHVEVDCITREIEEAEFLKMDIMTAIANIKSSNLFSASITQHQMAGLSLHQENTTNSIPNSQMCLLL